VSGRWCHTRKEARLLGEAGLLAVNRFVARLTAIQSESHLSNLSKSLKSPDSFGQFEDLIDQQV